MGIDSTLDGVKTLFLGTLRLHLALVSFLYFFLTPAAVPLFFYRVFIIFTFPIRVRSGRTSLYMCTTTSTPSSGILFFFNGLAPFYSFLFCPCG